MSFWRIDEMPALEWLRQFGDETVDLIITDPAYEALERHREVGTTARLGGKEEREPTETEPNKKKWFPTIPNAQYLDLAREWLRVLKKGGVLYLFGDVETQVDVASPALHKAGWVFKKGSKTFRKAIHWDKMSIGMGYQYREQVELIWILAKGGWPEPPDRKARNFFTCDETANQAMRVKGLRNGRQKEGVPRKYYPTEKPVEGLLSVFVERSSSPGDLVIDCFGGSFSTGEAALAAGRNFMGCDIHPPALARGRARLARFGEIGDEIPSVSPQPCANQGSLF